MTWVLIGAGLLGVYWLLRRRATPIYYRGQHQADVPRFIQSMFQLLRPRAIVQLAHEGSERRLRIRKIYRQGKRHGVRLELPSFDGADRYVDQVRADLAAGGFPCSVPGPIDPLWPAQDPPLLVVDGLSALDAFRATEVARAALGLGQDARYTIHMEGTPSLTATREYLHARNAPPAA